MERVDRVGKHKRIVTELNDLYKAKNHDYGNSFKNVRDEVDRAIIVRLMDKIERLKVLTKTEAKVKDESIEDTLRDLANYAIMELVEREVEREQAGKEGVQW